MITQILENRCVLDFGLTLMRDMPESPRRYELSKLFMMENVIVADHVATNNNRSTVVFGFGCLVCCANLCLLLPVAMIQFGEHNMSIM